MKSSAKSKVFGRVLMGIGGVLVVCAAGIFAYNMWDDYRAGEKSEQTAQVVIDHISEQHNESPEVKDEGVVDNEDKAEKPQRITINGADYIGVLNIPDLKLTLPVQEDWSLKKLKTSPCLYHQDEGKNMVIAAHNYTRHFGKLHYLKQGSELIFTDAAGEKHVYVLKKMFTANEGDVEGMINSDYDLTLFTCTYSGDARVTLRYNLVER